MWVKERPDLRALPDAGLIAYGRTASYRQRPTWDVYCMIMLYATVGPRVVGPVAASLGFPDAVGGTVQRDRRCRERGDGRPGVAAVAAGPGSPIRLQGQV